MSYSVYAILMLIFFVLVPFYLFSRIIDYTGYVFIGAIRKGKKEWNWFPEMNKKLYSLLLLVAIISAFIGATTIRYVNWDSLSGYYAYPLFYILIASILLLVYLFEKLSPYSPADSIRAKLDHKNLLEVGKNNSLALMENEKVQPNIHIENLKIESNHSQYINHFKNITKEGDTHNKTVKNIYHYKELQTERLPTERLPFEKQEHLKDPFKEAVDMGLSKDSLASFRMMIEDGYCPQQPLLFTNSRIVKGVPEVNKAAVLDLFMHFFKFTSDDNTKWAYEVQFLIDFIKENSKFQPDNIKGNKSINDEIRIDNATFSRAKKKLCKNQKA